MPEDPPEAQDVGLQAMRCLQGEKQRRQEAVVQLQHARAQMAREVRNALRAAVAGIMFAGAEVLLAFSDGTATLRDAEAGWKAALDEQEVAEKQAAREAGRVFHMFINDRVAHTSHRASLASTCRLMSARPFPGPKCPAFVKFRTSERGLPCFDMPTRPSVALSQVLDQTKDTFRLALRDTSGRLLRLEAASDITFYCEDATVQVVLPQVGTSPGNEIHACVTRKRGAPRTVLITPECRGVLLRVVACTA